MIEEKTIQQCLQEVNFYEELEKLRADLKYRGLKDEESTVTFDSSTSWNILTKKNLLYSMVLVIFLKVKELRFMLT